MVRAYHVAYREEMEEPPRLRIYWYDPNFTSGRAVCHHNNKERDTHALENMPGQNL
jgi:hypothetical protein